MLVYRVSFMVRSSGDKAPAVIQEADFPEHDKALDAALAWQKLGSGDGHVFEVALVDLPDA